MRHLAGEKAVSQDGFCFQKRKHGRIKRHGVGDNPYVVLQKEGWSLSVMADLLSVRFSKADRQSCHEYCIF